MKRRVYKKNGHNITATSLFESDLLPHMYLDNGVGGKRLNEVYAANFKNYKQSVIYYNPINFIESDYIEIFEVEANPIIEFLNSQNNGIELIRKLTESVNIDSFFENTYGIWDNADIEADEMESLCFDKVFESNDGSKYYVNDINDEAQHQIFRVSDHWGGGIGSCNWYLDGHKKTNSYTFKEDNNGELFVGVINFSDLEIQ